MHRLFTQSNSTEKNNNRGQAIHQTEVEHTLHNNKGIQNLEKLQRSDSESFSKLVKFGNILMVSGLYFSLSKN